jgi:hypothetical protein
MFQSFNFVDYDSSIPCKSFVKNSSKKPDDLDVILRRPVRVLDTHPGDAAQHDAHTPPPESLLFQAGQNDQECGVLQDEIVSESMTTYEANNKEPTVMSRKK